MKTSKNILTEKEMELVQLLMGRLQKHGRYSEQTEKIVFRDNRTNVGSGDGGTFRLREKLC